MCMPVIVTELEFLNQQMRKQGIVPPSPDAVVNMFNNYIGGALTTLLNTALRGLQEASYKLQRGDIAGAVSSALPAIAGTIGTMAIFDLLQSSVLGNYINLRKVSDKIDRLFSPELIVSAVVGALIGSGVQQPAQFLANRIFTPQIPGIRELVIAYIKRKITFTELTEYLMSHGYHAKWHDLIIDLNDYTPSIGMIERLMRYYPPDQETLVDWLRENGVTDADIDYYLNYLKYSMIRDEVYKVEGYIRDLYVNGLLSEQELDKYLEQARATPEERAVLKEGWRKLKLKNLYKLYIDKQIYLFRKGAISIETLYERLASLYADKEFAQAVTALEGARVGIEWAPS